MTHFKMPTIAAIATPPGSGGIGIIRISGEDAVSIAASVFQKKHAPCQTASTLKSFESHRLYYGHIADPENNRILDEVLLAVMYAPHSYTCEDVVEIQAHSGYAVLRAILELVLRKGARLAEPGEFTRRAYLNGRIDLTRAEAVIDIIHAKTDKAIDIAAAQLRGSIRDHIESIRHSLLDILSQTEAAIDFPEAVEDISCSDIMKDKIRKEVIDKLENLIHQYEVSRFIREGMKVVIAGKPNVGKSSILNRLIQKDRAIVTAIPGTTRDLIEEPLNISGIPVIITDTAGLHPTDDPVETIGIQKTREYLDHADMVLFVIDAASPLMPEDYELYEAIGDKHPILVMNKQDLVREEIHIPDLWENLPIVRTSARYDSGIDSLRDQIAAIAVQNMWDMEHAMIPNLRHKTAIEKSLRAALSASEGMASGISPELISIDIQEAIDSLGEILGIIAGEAVLDQIFSRFCIGK